MKRFFTLLTASLIGLTTFGQAFTVGNLVVYRVGDGSAALTSAATAVFLDEFTPSGTLVRSIAMPTTATAPNKIFTAAGSSTSEGLITRSANGLYLMATGYDAAPGTASLAGTSAATINRMIARIDNAATVNNTMAISDGYNGSNFRSAYSTDGNAIWMSGNGTSGSGSIRYATFSATPTTTQISSTITNTRAVDIVNGQLYISAGSTPIRLATVGTGTPTTTGQAMTNLPGLPTSTGSPYQFFFADLDAGVAGVDVLYLTDDAATGLVKYSLVGGTWTSNGAVISMPNCRGLTATISGNTVTLYAVNGSSLLSLVDATGYNVPVTATATTLATAPTNTAFRGVAWAPTATSLPLNLISFNASIINGTVKAWWSTSNEVNTASFEVERSIDGRNFVTVAQKAAKNVSGINTYEALDATPLSGLAYYRLKMIDKDGTVKYSQLVKLRNKTTTKLEVFPNPTNGALSISHSKASNGAAIRIFTLEGKLVKSINAQRDAVQTAINIAELVNGNYQIVFENNGERSVTKIVKQ